MSIPVALDELRSTSGGYRFAYLMTTSDDGRPHAVAVSPAHDGADLVVTGVGRRTASNAEARPAVSLVWPPDVIDGYSLIVDGQASVERGAGADGARVVVSPTKAVLHRPAPSPDPTSSCTSDCRSVPLD